MIPELVEKTVGNRRAVQIILLIPFLPKNLFLGAKFRYFNRFNLDQDAADYIRALVRKPRITVALKLHQIMSSFGPLLFNDEETLKNIRELRELLIVWKPETPKDSYRKIRTLVKCFEFDNARSSMQEFGHLLKHRDHRELDDYFRETEGLLTYFSQYTTKAWNNLLQGVNGQSDGSDDPLVIFYLPPTLSKLEMGSQDTASFYKHTSEYLKILHESIPRDRYRVIDKLQFGWRTVKEVPGNQLVVSYHTKGIEKNSLRIKESAFSNYLTMDSTGFSGWHSAAELDNETLDQFLATTSTADIESTFQQLNTELVQSNVSKYAQVQQPTDTVAAKGDFFFVALQVANDIVAELAYIDTYNLLKAAAEIAEKHQLELVIKRHPKCTSARIKDLLQELEGHPCIEISSASIHELLPACKALITVNSGVGMEALLHLTDVISTGKSEYSFIAKTAHSRAELESHMLQFSPTEPEKIKAFLHYYATKHLYRFDDTEKLKDYWKAKPRFAHKTAP